jgi:hypothetical protein
MLAALLALGLAADPKSLEVPVEKTAAAKALIAKLDDDNILVRDKATADLKAMGREALPALQEAAKGKLPERVRNSVDVILPAAKQADFEARAKVFRADKEAKFEHDLPGWTDLKAMVKDTKESRQLMADMLNDEDSRAMLLSAFDTTEDGRKQFEKRWEVRQKEWFVEFRDGRSTELLRPRPDQPLHWMVASLLADLLYEHDYSTSFRGPVLEGYAKSAEGKLAAGGEGKHGEVVRQFVRRWVERQEQPLGLYDGEWLAKAMGFETAFLRQCQERQFEIAFASRKKPGIITTLAHTRDAKYIATFRRVFDWEDAWVGEQFAQRVGEIQVRDAALAMCIALSGQDPVDYGFSAQRRAAADDDGRYWTENYYFKGEGKTTADDKRKAAFKKWAEWEKANPDAIKAKAPDKK